MTGEDRVGADTGSAKSLQSDLSVMGSGMGWPEKCEKYPMISKDLGSAGRIRTYDQPVNRHFTIQF